MMDLNFALDGTVLQALVLTLGVILADTLLGLVRSIARGEFDVRKLPQFLTTNVFPYAGGLLVLALFSAFIEEIKAILLASAGLVLLPPACDKQPAVSGGLFLSGAFDRP